MPRKRSGAWSKDVLLSVDELEARAFTRAVPYDGSATFYPFRRVRGRFAGASRLENRCMPIAIGA